MGVVSATEYETVRFATIAVVGMLGEASGVVGRGARSIVDSAPEAFLPKEHVNEEKWSPTDRRRRRSTNPPVP